MVASSVIFLVHTAVVIAVVSGECKNGWTRFDNSCYRLHREKKTWPEAQFECEKEDAFLVLIQTKQESFIIHALIDKLHVVQESIWIGLSDVRHESLWVWEDSKENATFFDWIPGEPNSAKEDCVELRAGNGYMWNDIDCGTQNFFLCERSRHFDWINVAGSKGLSIRENIDFFSWAGTRLCEKTLIV